MGAKSSTKYHVMSITKGAIGLMYHIHKGKFPRTETIPIGEKECSVGDLLNMASGHSDKGWNYDEYRQQVEVSSNLGEYARKALAGVEITQAWRYNNLVYQLLASKMPDVAERFGAFMGDGAGPLKSEQEQWKNSSGVLETHTTWFRHGTSWKWEHTASGEPLGPHGLWLTPSCAKLLGQKAAKHLQMGKAERVDIGDQGWGNVKTPSKLKFYWNGWWFSERCAYAIGHVCQLIAVTPYDVRVQIYEEDWDNPLDKNQNDPKWFFIDQVEEQAASPSPSAKTHMALRF